MAHFSRVAKVVVDVPAADHDGELGFWSAATGTHLSHFERAPEYHGGDLGSPDLWLLVQRTDEGGVRVHLDVHTDDVDAEVARLEALGARRVRQERSWWIMCDPAGLPFCVIPQASGLDESNARRWG